MFTIRLLKDTKPKNFDTPLKPTRRTIPPSAPCSKTVEPHAKITLQDIDNKIIPRLKHIVLVKNTITMAHTWRYGRKLLYVGFQIHWFILLSYWLLVVIFFNHTHGHRGGTIRQTNPASSEKLAHGKRVLSCRQIFKYQRQVYINFQDKQN